MYKCQTKNDLNDILCGRVGPQIYAFTVDKAEGYTKIGDTYRPLNLRLSEWEKIFGCSVNPIYRNTAIIDGKVYYRDISIHKYLKEQMGKERLTKQKSEELNLPYYSQEFFKEIITPDNIESAREDIESKYRDRDYTYYDYYDLLDNDNEEDDSFEARQDQKNAIESFKNAIKKHNKLLMYAVMRFGKSFTAMCCAKEIENCKFILIVSAKKDVIGEWEHTVKKHVKFKNDFIFLTVDSLKNDYNIVNKYLSDNKRIVVCTTLQDLQGKEIKKRYKQLFKYPIDLMIIDEAHFGAGGDIQGEIIRNADIGSEEEKREEIGVSIEKINQLLQNKTLSVRYQLFLSGTPYTLLAQKEFSEEQIICSVRYSDIIRQKNEISAQLTKDENKKEWENEYYSFPEMIRFGFNLCDDEIQQIANLKQFNWSGELSELFRIDENSKKTKHPKFIHRNDVLNLFKAIDGSQQYDNILDFLNFDAVKEDRICRHIVICLNQKAMCNALEDLLIEESDSFINLKTKGDNPNYKIINISGDRNKYNIKNIRNTISSCEERGQKTISLTVRRMMTGVTVKEWDTMLMLKSTKSPEEYDQAIFRLQSGYTKKIFIKEDNNKDDYIVENLKPQTLVVDFDLNRMFVIQEKASSLNGFKSNREMEDNSFQGKLEDDLKFAPIITMNKNEIHQVNAVDIIKAITNYTKNKSIVEEVSSINYQELDIDYNNELLELILKQNELTVASGKFNTKAFEGENSKIDKRKLKKVLGELEKKKKSGNKLTTEEKNLIDGLTNKKKMLIAKILFFAYLSPDDIRYHKDIIDKIDGSIINKRISKNLDLTKKDVELIFKYLSNITKDKLDTKIAKANILSSDENIKGVDKNLAALAEFNRFSDSEIVTPLETCLDILNLIGKDNIIRIIKEGNKILDIASKQGEFAYAISKLLENEKIDFTDAIYSVPTSSIAYEFTRHMYESLGLNTANIADTFSAYDIVTVKTNNELNYEKVKRNITRNIPFNKIKIDENRKGDKKMIKFDVVVGNPPYQEKGGSGGNNDAPIYQNFVLLANALGCQYYSLITKAAWLSAGRKALIDPFRRFMMDDRSLKSMYVKTDASSVFGKGVEIKGGICYFLHDSKYNGMCNYVIDSNESTYRDLADLRNYNVIIRDTIRSNIVKKVINTFDERTKTMDTFISNDTPFGIPSNPKTSKKNPVKVYSNKSSQHNIMLYHIENGERKKEWVEISSITKNSQDIDKIKVFIPESGGSGNDSLVLGDVEIAPENSACSQSYLYFKVKDIDEANNLKKYLESRFLRILVSSIKITQTATPDVYRFVPVLDFSKKSKVFYDENNKERTIKELDEYLFNKYGFNDFEKKYIKQIIKEK